MTHDKPGTSKPYRARVTRGGNDVSLGYFATAEEAALCVARTPEGQAAAKRPAAAAPLTSTEARQQARAEGGLTLRVADNKAGYLGVTHKPGRSKPYAAQVKRGGNKVRLGSFVTAEEAALYVARSPEGRTAAAERAASATQPRWSEEEGQGNAPPRAPAQCSSRRELSRPCQPALSSRRRSSRTCHPASSSVVDEGVGRPRRFLTRDLDLKSLTYKVSRWSREPPVHTSTQPEGPR